MIEAKGTLCINGNHIGFGMMSPVVKKRFGEAQCVMGGTVKMSGTFNTTFKRDGLDEFFKDERLNAIKRLKSARLTIRRMTFREAWEARHMEGQDSTWIDIPLWSFLTALDEYLVERFEYVA